MSHIEIADVLEELGNVNAYLYFIEGLLDKIFDIIAFENIEVQCKEIAKMLAPNTLNIERLILNKLFH